MISVSIIGAGSVGVFLTHLLNKESVSPILVFRNEIQREVIFERSDKVHRIRYTPALYNEYEKWLSSDVLIIATKAYDAEYIIRDLSQRRSSAKAYVLVQNGLKIFEKAVDLLGSDRVIQLLLNHGIARVDKNRFIWNGGGRSYIGMLAGSENPYLYVLRDLLHEIDLEVVKDIQPYRWLKLSVNAVINPVTAILEERNKVVVENSYVRDHVAKRICEEIVKIAELRSVRLPKDPYEEVMRVARETGQNYSSMYMDIKLCRRTEIDYINGAVVEYGSEDGYKAYYNEIMYYLVKAKEARCFGRQDHS